MLKITPYVTSLFGCAFSLVRPAIGRTLERPWWRGSTNSADDSVAGKRYDSDRMELPAEIASRMRAVSADGKLVE
ncbi:hypothetical protein ABQF33_07310 [Mycolicibacterium sp. XJ2]